MAAMPSFGDITPPESKPKENESPTEHRGIEVQSVDRAVTGISATNVFLDL